MSFKVYYVYIWSFIHTICHRSRYFVVFSSKGTSLFDLQQHEFCCQVTSILIVSQDAQSTFSTPCHWQACEQARCLKRLTNPHLCTYRTSSCVLVFMNFMKSNILCCSRNTYSKPPCYDFRVFCLYCARFPFNKRQLLSRK